MKFYDDFDTEIQSDEFAAEYEQYLFFIEEEEALQAHMEEDYGDIL